MMSNDPHDPHDPHRPQHPGEEPARDDAHDAARTARDDYLWDRRGAPDATVAALEGALAGRRWQGRLPDDAAMDAAATASDPDDLPGDADALAHAGSHAHGDAPRPRSRRETHPRLFLLTRVAAALLVLTALFGIAVTIFGSPGEGGAGEHMAHGAPDAPSYRLLALDGAPRLDGVATTAGPAGAADAVALGPGSRVETDAASRARVSVGEIGSVELHPESRLRVGSVEEADDPAAGYLLHLDRGALTASIFAAPRLFQLGTPSGMAVDMGCVYTARVAEDGVTALHVELGQVSFETPGRRVLVPSGAGTRAWPGAGPGTPVWDDAPAAFADAVARFDERVLRDGQDADPRALDALLAGARQQDTLTLWHLLAHAADATGPALYTRLAELEPPPPGVTREACLSGDRDALLAWRDVMGWAWPADTPTKSGEASEASKKVEKGKAVEPGR